MKILLSTFFLLLFFFTAVAQTEREAGIAFFNAGNYDAAIESLKKAAKKNSKDANAYYYLGLAYLRKDETKDAVKAFKKGIEIRPDDSLTRVGLAYAYLLQNNSPLALAEAEHALKLDAKDFQPPYILGVIAYREGDYDTAYDRAAKAVELAPKAAPPYLLKSQALVAGFLRQKSAAPPAPTPRYASLREAEENLHKFLGLAAPGPDTDFQREYLESIRYFSKYFNETRPGIVANSKSQTPAAATRLQILDKPRAFYTNIARLENVQGTVDLLVGFGADGTIRHILISKPLSHGLSESAVQAARKIKFTPATLDGKPVSTVITVRYFFELP